MKLLMLFVVPFLLTAAQAFAQGAREVWDFSPPAKLKFQTALPSGDLLVSTDRSTLLLSGVSGEIKWQREDLISCEKASHPKGLARIRSGGLPFWTCQLDGNWERMTFLGPYLRLQSDVPEGTPGAFLYFKCGFLQSCLEAGSLGGAPKTISGGWDNTHSDNRLVLVNLETGQDAFDSLSAGLKKVDGTCLLSGDDALIVWEERNQGPAFAAAFDLSQSKTLWTGELPLSREIQCVPLGGARMWLAYGKTERGQRGVVGMDASGRARWESVELARKDWAKLPVGVTDTDSTAVVHVDESGPTQISLQNGRIVWRAPVFRGEDPAGDARGRNPRPQPIVRHEDRIFVIQKKKLAALDANSGGVLWTSEFDGPVMILAPTDHGLLVREYDNDADSTLHLLRYDTGKALWARFIGSRQTGWVADKSSLYYIVSGKLRSLSLQTGRARDIGEVKFADGETPSALDFFDGALLVLASQSVAVFERNGSLRYQRHYQAPGLSLAEQLLKVTAATAMTALSRQAARSSAQSAANTAAYLRGDSVTMWYTYNVYSPKIDERLPAGRTAEGFVYLYTEESETVDGRRFSIIQLQKATGKETARLRLKERRPDYAAHPTLPRVFVRAGESSITAYEFPTNVP